MVSDKEEKMAINRGTAIGTLVPFGEGWSSWTANSWKMATKAFIYTIKEFKHTLDYNYHSHYNGGDRSMHLNKVIVTCVLNNN
jgi:hypothetical protein